VALPVLLGATAFGFSLDQAFKVLVYSAPLWAPIGAGMGMFVTSNLTKGIRAKPPK
jgi:hypothetical protein